MSATNAPITPQITALIIDTETDQGHDPLPIQVATIDLATGKEWMRYFNSGRPIAAMTTQIHGITDADVAGLSAFDLTKFAVPTYLIGHNVRFDWRVIGSPDAKLICTVRLARLAFPEWDSYKQSRCIEQLLSVQGDSGKRQAWHMIAKAHDALGDVQMCHMIYRACCERLGIATDDYAAAMAFSEKSAKITPTGKKRRGVKSAGDNFSSAISSTIMPFGKHKGMVISEMPKSYVKWLLTTATNLQPNLATALRERARD